MAASPPAFEREYYDTYYRDYDRQNPPRKMSHYRQTVERHLPAGSETRILDIGCAFGAFLGALDTRWQLYGMDVSEYAISQARTRLPRAHLDVVHDGVIPFHEPFDVITAWDVIEHIPELDMVAAQVTAHLTAHGATRRTSIACHATSGCTGPRATFRSTTGGASSDFCFPAGCIFTRRRGHCGALLRRLPSWPGHAVRADYWALSLFQAPRMASAASCGVICSWAIVSRYDLIMNHGSPLPLVGRTRISTGCPGVMDSAGTSSSMMPEFPAIDWRDTNVM